MTINEIAAQLYSMCRNGKFRQAIDELYSDSAVSIEPFAQGPNPREVKGKDAILRKSDAFQSAFEIHEIAVEGPFVSPEFISLLFTIDVTNKMTGERVRGREIAIYTVENGKINSDRFLSEVSTN